jgi:hypothetical protein
MVIKLRGVRPDIGLQQIRRVPREHASWRRVVISGGNPILDEVPVSNSQRSGLPG